MVLKRLVDKGVACLAASAMALALVPAVGVASAYAAEDSSGISGGVAWNYTASNTTLTVSAADSASCESGYSSGQMPDYLTRFNSPFYNLQTSASISTVVVSDGVTNIGNYSFSDNTTITSVSIGKDVKTIGDDAFADDTSLPAISIGKNVQTIGASTFASDTSLAAVTISGARENGENASALSVIGQSAFFKTGLKSFIIPNFVTTIGPTAFSGCASLSTVDFGDSLTGIGKSAFQNCTSLSAVNIPASVGSIGSGAFRGDTGITSITFAEGSKLNTTWASSASDTTLTFYQAFSSATPVCVDLSNCTALTDSKKMFQSCNAAKIIFPEGVTDLTSTSNYLLGCPYLTAVVLPSTVDHINTATFGSTDTALTDIDIDAGSSLVLKSEDSSALKAKTLSLLGESEKVDQTYDLAGFNTTGGDYATDNAAYWTSYSSKTYYTMTFTGETKPTVVYCPSTDATSLTDCTDQLQGDADSGWTLTVKATGDSGNDTSSGYYATVVDKGTQTIAGVEDSYTATCGNNIALSPVAQGTFTYGSDNTSVATVSSDGTITAKGAGTATITITAAATEDYASATKTITVKVNAPSVGTASLITSKTISTKAHCLTVRWRKVSGVRGYQIKLRLKGHKAWTTITVTSASTLQKVIKHLKGGKRYQVKVHAFKKAAGKTYYGGYSGTKTVKVKG